MCLCPTWCKLHTYIPTYSSMPQNIWKITHTSRKNHSIFFFLINAKILCVINYRVTFSTWYTKCCLLKKTTKLIFRFPSPLNGIRMAIIMQLKFANMVWPIGLKQGTAWTVFSFLILIHYKRRKIIVPQSDCKILLAVQIIKKNSP